MHPRILIAFLLLPGAAFADKEPVAPRLEFAFEERVTIAPAVIMGDTALGYRQYIPITGGTVSGPALQGRVENGGFDFQLTHKGSDCTQLSADYFLKSDDGAYIHVFNEGMSCPKGERMIMRPKLEAPLGTTDG